MVSSPCDVNDRDSGVPIFPHKTDNFSSVIKEVMMAFYSDVEEVKNVKEMIANDCKVIILMRGLPGSGKSTLARYLMETFADTSATKEKHVFSADDYFIDPENNAYLFNRKFLEEAHSWNVETVLAAAQKNVTPIIVDNTNLTVSEMWPYACIAAKYYYIIRYLEPSTHWRYNIHECAKRNLHGVSEKHIARMMGRFDRSVSESELLSLVSSRNNNQNYCDTHGNCRRVITRYSQQKHYAENRLSRQLHSICIHNNKTLKPISLSDSCLPNLPNVLTDSANTIRTLRTSRLPATQQFVLTSLPSSSSLVKSLLFGEISSIMTTCSVLKEDQTCKTVSLRNNVLDFYNRVFKWMSFLHLLVCVRNVGIYATQFMSMKEMRDRNMSLEKYRPLTTYDILDKYGISRGNKVRVILAAEHDVQPSININNVKVVVFPTDIRSLLLPAPENIRGGKEASETDNQNKKNEVSHLSYSVTVATSPSLAKIGYVEGRSTSQANSGDLEDAKSTRRSGVVHDSSKTDSWNVCDEGNSDPWGESDSGGCSSWDMSGNVSWETETVLTQHTTPHESSHVVPKPARTDREKRIAERHSREQKPVKIERRTRAVLSTAEKEKNCSLPKPRRTNIKPRTTQYSCEQYRSKLESKKVAPELAAWNAVEDPLSSWERKQNSKSGNATDAGKSHKSQVLSSVPRKISAKNHKISPESAGEKEHMTSKPQREKRTRNRQ